MNVTSDTLAGVPMAGFEHALIGRALGIAAKPLMESVKHALARRGYGKTDAYTAVSRTLSDGSRVPSTLTALWNLPDGITQQDVESVLDSAEGYTMIRLLIAVSLESAGKLPERINTRVRDSLDTAILARAKERYSKQQALGMKPKPSWKDVNLDAFKRYVDQLASNLNNSCKAWANELVKSLRDPDDALDWAYQNLVLYRLGAIDQYLERISDQLRVSDADFQTWLNNYRVAFGVQHSMIQVPDLLDRKLVAYKDLFVPASFAPVSEYAQNLVPKSPQRANDELNLAELTNRLRRTVILGDPGAGKSTTSTYVALQAMGNEKAVVSFVLVLKNLKVDDGGFNVIEAIEETATNSYQCSPPAGVVRDLLVDGRALVVFDGLDELMDGTTRQATVQSIDMIAALYPLSTFIVTARRIGYSTTRLRQDLFDEFVIGSFSDSQVEQYVRNWFSVEHRAGSRNLERTVMEFMDISRPISDLRSNPLMLAFICVLYRGRISIPHKRPEIFRQCVDLFMQQWDRRRGMWDFNIDLDLVELALSYVAHAILTQPEFKGGVTEGQVYSIVETPLLSEGVPDRRGVRDVVRELLRLCRGRAWIFTDVGLNEHGEDLFLFTHASFLEYFAALHIHRSSRSSAAVADVLIPQISNGNWEVLAQICIAHRMRNTVGGSTEIIHRILAEAESIVEESRKRLTTDRWLSSTAETAQYAEKRNVDVALVDFLLRLSETMPISSDVLDKMVTISAEHFVSGRSAALSTLFGAGYRYVDAVHGKLQRILNRAISDYAKNTRNSSRYTSAMAWFAVHLGYIEGSSLVHAADTRLLQETRRTIITPEVVEQLKHGNDHLSWNVFVHCGGDIGKVDSSTLHRLFSWCHAPISNFGPPTTASWILDCFSAGFRRALPVSAAARVLEGLSYILNDGIFDNPVPIGPEIDRFTVPSLRAAASNLASYRTEIKVGWIVFMMCVVELWELSGNQTRSEILAESGMGRVLREVEKHHGIEFHHVDAWIDNAINVWHQEGPLNP